MWCREKQRRKEKREKDIKGRVGVKKDGRGGRRDEKKQAKQ